MVYVARLRAEDDQCRWFRAHFRRVGGLLARLLPAFRTFHKRVLSVVLVTVSTDQYSRAMFRHDEHGL